MAGLSGSPKVSQSGNLTGIATANEQNKQKSETKRNKQAKLNEQLLCIIYLQNENMSTKKKQDRLQYSFSDY